MNEGFDLVINLPGSIPRLPLHIGALNAWYELGLPRPDEIIASSSGAMAGSAFIGWDEDSSEKAARLIGDLSPDQIFSFRRGLKVKLAALGITTIGLGLLVLFDHKLSKGKKAILGLAGLAALLATDAMVSNELVHSESHLSPGPLRKLLIRELDFHAIFNSPIRLGIIVADVSKPGEVVFYNHHPLNNDSDNPEHWKRWINILLASARLPGKFPFIKIDGVDTVDGEVWTDFPIRQMKHYRKAVRFDYWPPLTSEPAPREWISDLSRSFDIMRDRCTHKKIEYYELERRSNPELPEIYYVRLSPELMRHMPHIKLHNFTPDHMKELENIGYATVMEQKEELRRYLDV